MTGIQKLPFYNNIGLLLMTNITIQGSPGLIKEPHVA